MSENKKTYGEFIADKLLLQLQKITVPKSQRLMVITMEDCGDYTNGAVGFEWYDSKEAFIDSIRKNIISLEGRDILLEVVCRNKQVDMKNPNKLYEDYLNMNK